MANRFVLNETSYHGSGAIKEIVNEAKGRGFKKALVCSDPDLLKFGVTKKVTDLLDEAGLAYEIYSDIKPNPTIEMFSMALRPCMMQRLTTLSLLAAAAWIPLKASVSLTAIRNSLMSEV